MRTAAEDEDLVTRREAARLARVSYNGIRGWERAGRVTTVRRMRGGVEEVLIPRAQIEEIIRERVESAMGEDAREGNLEVEIRMLREDRDRLKADLEAERRRYDLLLAKLLELTGESH